MVMCCAVVSCKNRAKTGSGITFHSFPSNKEMLVKWLQAIGRENYKPNDFAKVCSAHFRNDDIYVDKYNRKHIKRGVVPSRFYTIKKVGKNRRIIEEIVPGTTNEQNNNTASGMIPNGSDVCDPICDSLPRFQQLKANNSSDTETVLTLSNPTCSKFTDEKSISNFNQLGTNSSGEGIGRNIKRRKLIKRSRKKEIEVQDFEKIDESRLADPKIVKQLLTIAYKTIQEQRKVISSWQIKYKNMEQKVVNLQRALRLSRNANC